jgi:protein TonB
MTASTLTWFDDDPRDLRRWAMAAAIVLGVHLAAIAAYVYVHRPDEIGDDSAPIAVDFTPGNDVVDQSEIDPTPAQPQPQVEQPPPPPPEQPEAVVATPQPPPPPIEQPPPQAGAQPAKSIASAPAIAAAWEGLLEKRLQRFKRYPTDAQSRGEQGVVLLSFSVDRSGRLLEHHVLRSSGHPALDEEAMSMMERAQPLPPFPPAMTEAKLDDLTVPIQFSLR